MLGVALSAVAAAAIDQAYLDGITLGNATVVAARSPTTAMKLIMMPDKGLKSFGAVCLDGSDAGFYYAPASDNSKNASWQLYFEGGGWCYDEKDCWGRSKGDLGNSTAWPKYASAGGIMSDDCTINPDFCNFHRVYMKYCDGNSFSGNRDQPIFVEGQPLYFRGHRILQAVLKTLTTDYGLSAAQEVVLTGCSAGGLSTILHADYVHSTLKAIAPQLTKFKAAPISGFFLDHDTVEGRSVYAHQMAYIFQLSNASGGVNSDCMAATPRNEQWRCNFADKAYEFTSSPIMLLNSALDSWQIRCIYTSELPPNFPNQSGTENGECGAVEGWHDCSYNPEKCTAVQMEVMNRYMDNFESIVSHKATYTKAGNGAFIHSCFTHCEAQNDHAYTRFTVNSVTMQQAVSKWWADDKSAAASTNSYHSCRYKTTSPHGCNPTCH